VTDQKLERSRLLLSAQRALLGAVPCNLRAVSVELRGSVLLFRAVFAHKPTDEETELLSVASTEIVSDFPQVMDVKEEFLVLPPPTRPEHLAEPVFLRAELGQ
jgi:hypothetical protein